MAEPTLAELWKSLPDSRVATHRRQTVYGPLGPMEPAYCVNCGRQHGCVTQEFIDRILVLCDACYETHGALTLPQVPPEIERAITQKEG